MGKSNTEMLADPFANHTTSIITDCRQTTVRPLQRLQKTIRRSDRCVGLAWYRSDQWELLRQVSVDADELAITHREWANQATRLMVELEAEGVRVYKIPIDVNHMVDWCARQNLSVHAGTRGVYTGEQAEAGQFQVVHCIA